MRLNMEGSPFASKHHAPNPRENRVQKPINPIWKNFRDMVKGGI
jgi:hypothetical protein